MVYLDDPLCAQSENFFYFLLKFSIPAFIGTYCADMFTNSYHFITPF